ncbi:hypothetical protein BpHYR1_017859 [Brachionus plicatilis]|uniref:Uncharacterized protein n=1 Tax=Brachionus plicatilis TaxID=10195 RepID=A0A3M7QZA2_BRAPC|nr:hypothetical protein BpHYR1_017859 [Brachionus plicatilis]
MRRFFAGMPEQYASEKLRSLFWTSLWLSCSTMGTHWALIRRASFCPKCSSTSIELPDSVDEAVSEPPDSIDLNSSSAFSTDCSSCLYTIKLSTLLRSVATPFRISCTWLRMKASKGERSAPNEPELPDTSPLLIFSTATCKSLVSAFLTQARNKLTI